MDTTDLSTRLDALLVQNPNLTDHGLNWRLAPGTTFEHDRSDLRSRVREVAICLVFLADAPQCRPMTDSYGLKHAVERIMENLGQGMFISNGALIAAAMLLGLKWVPCESPNILIGVPREWARKIEKLAEKRAGRGMERARPWLPPRRHVACAGGR